MHPTTPPMSCEEGTEKELGLVLANGRIRVGPADMPRLVPEMGSLDMRFELRNFAFVEGDSRYKVKVKLSKAETLRITLLECIYLGFAS